MRLKVEAKAIVTYICELTEEDSNLVLEYMKENEVDENEAINHLWTEGEIDIYAGNQTESEHETDEINYLGKLDVDEDDLDSKPFK